MLAGAEPGLAVWHPHGSSDMPGVAGMGVVETLVHTWEITSAPGVSFAPDPDVCRRTLARLFPDVQIAAEPWHALLWATGRITLPGHPRRGAWRWSTHPGTRHIRLLERGRTENLADMPRSTVDPPFDQFMATAEAVAQARPEVDLELAREVFHEAATLLDNGLALDGLDEHDARAVVAGLCVDLVAEDPGAAVRARSRATLEGPRDLHDPEAVSASYLVAAAILQL